MRRTYTATFGGASWVLLAFVGQGMGTVLPRAPQTNATCSPMNGEDWLWMDNAQEQTPCLAAAFTITPCASQSYNVVALTSGAVQYASPSGNNVSTCMCSWAVYNLLSACTLCQGFQSSIPSWVSWTQNCGSFISTTRPYPANVSIPQGVTFPNWAAQNPLSWPEQRFDGNTARNYEVQHPGDWTDPLSPKANGSKGSNVGAIAGGVVGGVVVLAIGIVVAIFLYCRNQRRQKAQQGQHAPQIIKGPLDHHVRSPSDLSAMVYSPLGSSSTPSGGSASRLLNSPTTFYTHDSNRNSFIESLMLSYAGTPPPQQAVPTQPNVFMTANGAVSPFTLERPSSQDTPMSAHDRKRSEASGELNGSSPGRGPMNPPAYSEAHNGRGDFSSQVADQVSTQGGPSSIITTPQNHSSRRPNEKRQSSGTMASQSTSTSTPTALWSHGGPTSLGGAAELISQMNTPAPTGATPVYTGPGPNTGVPRDEKRRPTITNQTSADDGHNARQ